MRLGGPFAPYDAIKHSASFPQFVVGFGTQERRYIALLSRQISLFGMCS